MFPFRFAVETVHFVLIGCYFGDEAGITCPADGWCVPETYRCNNVPNCPSMLDETDLECSGTFWS